MSYILIGGKYNATDEGHQSKLIWKLGEILQPSIVFSGGDFKHLNQARELVASYKGNGFVFWAPDISNNEEKIYPQKRNGTVLICSKIMRETYTLGDAVSRCFKMNANACVAIYKKEDIFNFVLIDALGNTWCCTNDIKVLCNTLLDFVAWTKNSVRIKSEQVVSLPYHDPSNYPSMDIFCDSVKKIAQKVEKERGGRYFGNCSTRCSFMFPSSRQDKTKILVSSRNMPKEYINPSDFVATELSKDQQTVYYTGEKKPSVDTPVQLNLYNFYPNINFFIHGHAHIEGFDTTVHYYPCGDMREVVEIDKKYPNPETKMIILNLKNHGFLIGTQNVEAMAMLAESLTFKYRKLGELV